MVSKRDAPAEVQHDHTTVAGLIPLLTYVENLESEIHQNPSDKRVAEIIRDNFSPGLLVDEDTTLLGFNAFKEFNTTFRDNFFALRIVDRKPVVSKSHKDGKGGVVGFATSWLFEQKKDGALFDGNTMYEFDFDHSNPPPFSLGILLLTLGLLFFKSEIFEVTWFPDFDEPLGGRRLVTKAFAVIGAMNLITQPKRGKKKPTHTKKVASGRVSKRSNRSKVD